MTANEKRLIRIASIMFIGYILPFQLAPIVIDFYQNYLGSIEDLHQNIERYEKLGEREEYWVKENQRAKQELNEVKAGILPGDNYELIGTKIQGLVKKIAKSTNITFKSLVKPELVQIDNWILVTQSMQFEANSFTLMNFLKSIDNNKVNLIVVNLDIRSYKNKLTGSIKITGFSKVLAEEEEQL